MAAGELTPGNEPATVIWQVNQHENLPITRVSSSLILMSGNDDSQKRRGRGEGRASVARRVRERVHRHGERFWRASDFPDLNAMAVAHELSRMAARGDLQRIRKGLYYRPKATVLGQSVPSASAALPLTTRSPLHPAGLSAASHLGLTTQNPGRPEFATPASSAPSALERATVHTRRPEARKGLDDEDAAVLELLRDRGRASDLSPDETALRLVRLMRDEERFARLTRAGLSEPPRVRAMLGAIGAQAGAPERELSRLRKTLNPLSRFDFGPLRVLKHAKAWQAK